MNPKDYLQQYRDTISRIQSLENHMEELRAESDYLRNAGGERIRLDAAAADLVDTGEQIGRQTQHMKELQQEVSRIILMVTDADRRILLTLVYIEGKTLSDHAEMIAFLRENGRKIREDREVRAVYEKMTSGVYEVRMSVRERGTTLLEVKLAVPDAASASATASKWEEKYTDIYQSLIENLF